MQFYYWQYHKPLCGGLTVHSAWSCHPKKSEWGISWESKPQIWTEGIPEAPRHLTPTQMVCGMGGIVSSAAVRE